MEKYEVADTIVVLSLALLVGFLISGSTYWVWGAVGLLIIHLLSFTLSSVIAKLWLKFAKVVGLFNTRVLFTFAYIVFLTPVGIFYRFFNPTKAAYFFKDNRQSYFEDYPKSYKVNFLQQW